MDANEMKHVMDVHAVMARASGDERLDRRTGMCNMRSFVITTSWVFTVERPEGNGWLRVADLLGLRHDSLWWVFRDDLPRYEPPTLSDPRVCEVPVLKRRQPAPCGRRGTCSFRVTNPEDGTWRIAGYCTRHDAEGKQAFTAEQEMRKCRIIPDPDPNTGGLLPCYFRWDWEHWYGQADSGWKVPRFGVRADDWPSSSPGPEKPRLSLIRGEGQDMLPDCPQEGGSLTLVRGGSSA